MKKRLVVHFALILISIFLISFSSALLFDDFWARINGFSISGKAVQETGWTQWFDNDNPGRLGNLAESGDYETLSALRIKYNFCKSPTKIECQTTKGIDYSKTGEIVTCDATKGAICVNKQQPDKICYDYKVRFYCEEKPQCTDSDNGMNYSVKGTTKGMFKKKQATKKDFCRNSATVREFYCSSNKIFVKDFKCKGKCKNSACITFPDCTDTDKGLNYSVKGTTKGAINGKIKTKTDSCVKGSINKLNENYCKGKELKSKRYKCASKCENGICIQEEISVSVIEAGPICVNSDGWTKWLNIDNPNGTGDWETLNNFKMMCSDICETPSKVECKTIEGKKYTETKENVTCSVNEGLICRNNAQEDEKCDYDYKVRFYCAKKREKFICSDSDRGINYNVKGTARLFRENKEIKNETDYCSSENMLVEMYCPRGEIEYFNYTCQNKCAEGVCV